MTSVQLCRSCSEVISWSPVPWADQRQRRGKSKKKQGKEARSKRRARCRNRVWAGHGASEARGYRVLHPALAGVMLWKTFPRRSTCHHADCERQWASPGTNGVVQKAGGSRQCTLPGPRGCCLELVYYVLILSIPRKKMLQYVADNKDRYCSVKLSFPFYIYA